MPLESGNAYNTTSLKQYDNRGRRIMAMRGPSGPAMPSVNMMPAEQRPPNAKTEHLR